MLLDQFQRLGAVIRLADDVYLAAESQGSYHAFPEERVIIADNDADLLGRCCAGHGGQSSGSPYLRRLLLGTT
ncbi:hypothetical protein NJB14197_47700 [Mycobacterium montefiorense]|uniref:Uncharacterized protein n=1 Tax=Mycobacterium montefiorense TaxID=154654 RepID=A0AA37PKM7_9MYCO|nr:hypothetical protein MmonteBS_45500 [Mycobacterium montefiorense]GKU35297.1 hypothetical protein NJB14191_26430 [Mycobacterium montefiorense]GKU40251.1 hypothetical protein NJB14192_22380 [Mycobacterium montefiorense]GKU46190.1 hypothetical protein NJB14194_28100 [Mycobacterium montefiorense]GKU53062.1 hypothetical protein NJB14195_43030 [Mycobacterium montefiorense]